MIVPQDPAPIDYMQPLPDPADETEAQGLARDRYEVELARMAVHRRRCLEAADEAGAAVARAPQLAFAANPDGARTLTVHAVNPANEAIHVAALDGPGPGGAAHVYEIAPLVDAPVPPEDAADGVSRRRVPHPSAVLLFFQNGPVNENGVGVNGITHEALLAVLLDRLDGFQAGPYACEENARAREHIHQALDWLKQRTLAREARGVEGTHSV